MAKRKRERKTTTKSRKRSVMCRACSKRYVPVGRTVSQTCPNCDATTVRKVATLNHMRCLADDLFSLWIRLRDFGGRPTCSCITCGKSYGWDDIDAGHFVKRGHDQTRYDEQNVHGQCRFCNRPNSFGAYKHWKDMSWEYGRNLDLLYGEGTAADLKKAEKSTFKFNRTGLREVAAKYHERLERVGMDTQYILDRYKAAAIEMLQNGWEK